MNHIGTPTTQRQEMRRVSGNIATTVLQVVREFIADGRTVVRGSDIETAVVERTGCSYGSPLRLLRQLSDDGRIVAEVDRSKSLYTLHSIADDTPAAPKSQDYGREAAGVTPSPAQPGEGGSLSLFDAPQSLGRAHE